MDPDVIPQDEDSQESLALQNALSPLPNTQPQPSQSSPHGGHQNLPVQIQLLSRPKEFTDSDLGLGFSFAPKVKINPGQYNRRLPSKPINTGPQDPVPQHASKPVSPQGFQQQRAVVPSRRHPFRDFQPSPPQTSDGVRPDEHVPELQVPASAVPRKQPPFRDVQLPTPLPIVNKQLYEAIGTPVPRHDTRSLPLASRSAQASRTSLPNDVSVSSPNPPRKIPREYSPRPAPVNRPVRDEHRASSRFETPSTRAPSCSSTQSRSNVKKKRSADRYHERHSSHRGRTTQRPDTPCQLTSTPNELHESWRRKFQESMTSCAGVLNSNFASLEEEAKEHINSIHSLKRRIKKQEQKLAHYEADTSMKTNTIQELETERAELLQQLEDSKGELDGRSSRLSKLEEKCRMYKEYLNEAVAEQQELYKATKDKCDGAVSQMKQEEEKRRALQKRELEQAEAAREHLRQVIKATVDEFSRKEHEFKTTIDNLNEKVQERDAEAVRERERVTTILRQNESIASLQNNLNDLGGKIGQVVSVVNDLASRHTDRDDSMVQEVQAKLDQMTERLQALDARVQNPTVITEKFEEAQERSVSLILDKLQPILDSQTETKETLQHFMIDIEEKHKGLWAAIQEREELLNDFVRERREESAELAAMLQHDLQTKEEELVEQSQYLQEMEETLAQRQDVIDGLRDEIADLERDQAKGIEQSDRLEQLRAKHEQLEGEARAKAALVVELQTKLHETKSAATSQTDEYKKKTESLQEWMNEEVARAQAAQAQAVEKAQRETVQEVNKIRTEFENRLHHVRREGAMLQNELETAKARVLALETDSNDHGQEMDRLKTELETAKSKDAGTREEAEKKAEAHRVALEKQSGLVNDLEAKLTTWERNFGNLASNAKAYDKAAFVILGDLKKWTQQNPAIQELASEMSKSQDEGRRQRFDSRFKALVEMEILQRAVMEYCQEQAKVVDALAKPSQGHNDAAESLTHATADLSLAAHRAGNSTRLAEALLNRRVTLRSPAQMSPHPRPPSVNTEQTRRRTASPPKSIMKAVLYDISSSVSPPSIAQQQAAQEEEDEEDEEMQQRTIGHRRSVGRQVLSEELKSRPRAPFRGSLMHGGTMLNRGPYNRPVARSNNRADVLLDATGSAPSQIPISAVEDLREDDTCTLPVDGRKRQEASGQDQNVANKRTKRTPTTKEATFTPRLSPSRGSAGDVHIAPRKRNPRSSNVQLASPMRTSQLSQAAHRSQNAAGLLSKGQGTGLRSSRRLSSQRDSQDPQSLFYQRLQSEPGNEESQESMALSQDALGDSQLSLAMHRSFTGLP